MPAFVLPLSVRDGDRTVRLTVRLARPLVWSAVRGAVCRAAGLGETAVLYRGVGAVEDSWLVGSPPLLAGCVLATAPENQVRSHDPLMLTVVAGPDAGRCAPVGRAAVIIGRSDDADLRLDDPAVSWRHASITPAAHGLSVSDLGSTNGVFVDGMRVDAPAWDGSCTAVTGSVIRVGNSVLQIQLIAEPAGTFRADGYGHVVRTGQPATVALALPAVPRRPTEPDPPPRRSLPVLSALIGAAVGAGLAVALRNPLYVAFAAFGPVTMIASAISDRLRGRRSLRRQRRDYRAAMARWQTAAHAATVTFRRRAWQEWPGPAELVRRAEAGSARLWTKSTDHGLTVSMGSGPHALPEDSRQDVTVPGLGTGPAATESPPDWISDVPVTIALGGALGFIGAAGRGLARYVIAQVACCYSPDAVAVALATDHDDLTACRDLPHAHDITEALTRAADSDQGRRLVVVLDGPTAIRSAEGAAALQAAGGTVAVLCLAHQREALPPQAVPVPKAALAAGRPTPTWATGELLERVCHALAPLRDRPTASAASLPAAVHLTGLTGPLDADGLRRRWRSGAARALLGCGSDGGALDLDLDADGPHLLIAGTTGSGKSELLQTLIASLAVNASPQTVTFLLVDYKGGAAFGAITELPHVVGVLTDLDPAGSARALASLRAELRRRERLEAAGAPRPAKLVVVIDEFATLAAELPDFLAGMLDIAQRGRSLGLHLVIATQRPAGVVSPAMRANISARICLRVTDPAESLDVIASPDAARLPPACPAAASPD